MNTVMNRVINRGINKGISFGKPSVYICLFQGKPLGIHNPSSLLNTLPTKLSYNSNVAEFENPFRPITSRLARLTESDQVIVKADGKSYWRNIQLLEGETLKIDESWRPSFFLQSIFWWVAIIMTLGLSLPFYLVARWARKRNSWTISNKRLLSRVGIFNRDSITIELSDVIDIKVKRPLATSFLGRGIIEIETRAGGEEPEMIIDFQHEPDDIRNMITAASSNPNSVKPPSQTEQIVEAILVAQDILKEQETSNLKDDILQALIDYEGIKGYQSSVVADRNKKES